MHGICKPKRVGNTIVGVFVFTLMLVVTADAYTVVMRGGRRVEIPSQFIVTASTLTYEVAPGVQVTLQMTAIDIPATEKANNEKPGSLLQHGQLSALGSSPPTSKKDEQAAPVKHARRTITNRDLESSMQRRLESESAYKSRRRQLGLPSVEESRRQAAAESESISAELEQKRIAERQTEDYWRARAASLRTEMAALDAELTYVRARLDDGPFPLSNGWPQGSFTTVTSVVPFISFGNFGRRSFGNFGTGTPFPGRGMHRPNVFVAPRTGAQITGRVAFGGGATRGQVFLNQGTFHRSPAGIGGPFPVFPNVAFGSTFPAYDYSYERSALITRFNELAAARAGLNARWRELEEEARRAGAPPGWLRP